MTSIASVSKSVANNFYGWCGTDSKMFTVISRWLDERSSESFDDVRCALLTKQLLNNLMATSTGDKERFMTQKYVIACMNISATLYERELGSDLDLEHLTKTTQELITNLSGRLLLYTPLDCLTIIRELDSSITKSDEEEAVDLLVFLSSHPSYYRVRADELAAAAIFYCSYETNEAIRDGIVLEKKYRYTVSQTVDVIQGMIDELLELPGWSLNLYKRAPLNRLAVTRSYIFDDDVVGIAAKTSMKDNKIILTDDELGSGAYGQVLRARSNTTYIAVKIQDDNDVAIRELSLMCTLSHTNVQSARSFSFQGDAILIHMPIQRTLHELIYSTHTEDNGIDKHDRIWVDNSTNSFEVINKLTRRSYARQLLQGLIYLADMRVVHGDIKPSNLLVTTTGVLKIADYGLATLYSPSLLFARDRTIMLYSSTYRDPNIDRQVKRFSFEADVYAAAVVLLEMEVGSAPIFEIPGVNYGCVQDRHLRTVCAQMLARDIYSRINARQALVFFE